MKSKLFAKVALEAASQEESAIPEMGTLNPQAAGPADAASGEEEHVEQVMVPDTPTEQTEEVVDAPEPMGDPDAPKEPVPEPAGPDNTPVEDPAAPGDAPIEEPVSAAQPADPVPTEAPAEPAAPEPAAEEPVATQAPALTETPAEEPTADPVPVVEEPVATEAPVQEPAAAAPEVQEPLEPGEATEFDAELAAADSEAATAAEDEIAANNAAAVAAQADMTRVVVTLESFLEQIQEGDIDDQARSVIDVAVADIEQNFGFPGTAPAEGDTTEWANAVTVSIERLREGFKRGLEKAQEAITKEAK